MANKIEAKVGKRIRVPELDKYGAELHELHVKFWPAYEKRGRKLSASVS